MLVPLLVFKCFFTEKVLSQVETGVKSDLFVMEILTGSNSLNHSILHKFHVMKKLSCFSNCLENNSCVALSMFEQACTMFSLQPNESDETENIFCNNTIMIWRKVSDEVSEPPLQIASPQVAVSVPEREGPFSFIFVPLSSVQNLTFTINLHCECCHSSLDRKKFVPQFS